MALHQQNWLVTVALVTSSLIALVANLLLLLVFCRRRGLRTISNRFTINLLLTNLLSSLLLIPLLIVDQEVSIPSNLATSFNATENVELIIQNENYTVPSGLIIGELREKDIIKSDLLDSAEEVIINDSFKIDISGNKSDIIEENTRNISEVTYTKNANETISNVLCYVAQSTVGLVCTASILSVLLIGIDQYFAVIHSLRYHSYIDKFRSMALILSSWLIAIFFAIISGLTQNESNLWQFCKRSESAAHRPPHYKTLNSIYAVMYFIIVIFIPFIAICIIYICIYAAAHNNSERMRKSTTANQSMVNSYIQLPTTKRIPSESRLNFKGNASDATSNSQYAYLQKGLQKGLQKVQSAPNFSNLVQEKEAPMISESSHTKVQRTCSERIGFITNLKYRISNASVFRYREETRAAKISILVIFMVLVCYMPYGLAVVLNSYAVDMKTPQSYNLVSLVLLIFSNIISPLLFAYRNRRIRREFLRFLGVIPQRNTTNSFVRRSIVKPSAVLPSTIDRHKRIEEECDKNDASSSSTPFLSNGCTVPQVIITCKVENDKSEKPSILKRVCSTKNWPNYKKCSFINVPESCWQTDSARGSFSSASTQISLEDG